jgi:hypothetical protein
LALNNSTTKVISKPLANFGFNEKRPLKTYLDGFKFSNDTGYRFTSMRDVMRRFAQNLK